MSDLCVNCNLCCNGSLFARVPVTPEEQARLPDEMRFFTHKGNLRMRQPCPCLGKDGACTCYDIRPEVCRTYHCKLSKKVEAGELEKARAQAVIKEIKQRQAGAVALAAQAMGKAQEAYPPAAVSRAFRDLTEMMAAQKVSNGFLARKALMERERYNNLIRVHLQSNYKT